LNKGHPERFFARAEGDCSAYGHTNKLPVLLEILTDHLKEKYQAEGKATFGV
jgi:hypothetical protein